MANPQRTWAVTFIVTIHPGRSISSEKLIPSQTDVVAYTDHFDQHMKASFIVRYVNDKFKIANFEVSSSCDNCEGNTVYNHTTSNNIPSSNGIIFSVSSLQKYLIKGDDRPQVQHYQKWYRWQGMVLDAIPKVV